MLDIAVRAGAWLRSDSIIVEEPIQIEELTNRPPWLASILEDGYFRESDSSKIPLDCRARQRRSKTTCCTSWTSSPTIGRCGPKRRNLAAYNEKFPRGFERLRANLGYRLRPAWVWQRKRYGAPELIVAVSNRGVASRSRSALAASGKSRWKIEVAWSFGCRPSLWRRHPARLIRSSIGLHG